MLFFVILYVSQARVGQQKFTSLGVHITTCELLSDAYLQASSRFCLCIALIDGATI